MKFKKYKRVQVAELHEYDPNALYSESFMSRLSISETDKENGSPKTGDMIARNPKNHDDIWLIAKDYFDENFEADDN